ncbi:MAG TPA: hypothetical protein DCR43_00815 [Bacteroidales bacterium]|nr:hypothetical protein [Bacteroidales bacterium]HBZ67157.1 hypothetical protein [Bacteroidales bacterium]
MTFLKTLTTKYKYLTSKSAQNKQGNLDNLNSLMPAIYYIKNKQKSFLWVALLSYKTECAHQHTGTIIHLLR